MQLDVALALERASSSEKRNTKKAYRVLMTSLFHSRGPIYVLRELSNSENVLLQPSQEKVCHTPEGHARSSLKKIWQSCLIAFPVGYSTAHISDSLFNFMWMKQPDGTERSWMHPPDAIIMPCIKVIFWPTETVAHEKGHSQQQVPKKMSPEGIHLQIHPPVSDSVQSSANISWKCFCICSDFYFF